MGVLSPAMKSSFAAGKQALSGFARDVISRFAGSRILSIAGVAAAVSCGAPSAQAATALSAVGWPDGMYMAYFGYNSATGTISWSNQGDLNSIQKLKTTSQWYSNSYFASTTAAYATGMDTTVKPAGWAPVLNPPSYSGAGEAWSRWFGFSLEGDFASYLSSNGYALAIQLNSITYQGTSTVASNASVYYYNNGTNDMNSAMMYDSNDVAWDLLSNSNYLIWDGQAFMNMLHPVVVSTDTMPTTYSLNYTISVVTDTTGSAYADVVDSVTAVGGVTPYSFSYTATVPEPSTYALVIGGIAGILVLRRRLARL